MKKVQTVEFVWFMWICICTGLFNFCGVHSSEIESESESADDPVSIVINKCDPDSFNSKEEVEKFTEGFGDGAFTFHFKYSLNKLKKRCEIKTVHFQLDSPSESELQENLTSVSTLQNEKEIIHAGFWNHGFFSYEPSFYINPENYCIKKMNATFLTVEICVQASTSKGSNGLKFPPTLEKCCGVDRNLSLNESREEPCEYTDFPPWKPKLMEDKKIHPNYYSSLPCPKMLRILPYQLELQIEREKFSSIEFIDIRVLENGQVETRESGNHNWKKLEENTYCIDGFQHQFTGHEITEEILARKFMVLQCPKTDESKTGKIKDIIYAAACFISSVVLLIIVIIHVLLWDQQNIHEWTKCAFSLAMFFWLISTFVRLESKPIDGICVFIAVASHFFHISVFCWMFLMNFDLWSTISSMTTVSQRSTERKRFLWFCCFALTIPTIVISISLIIENKFSLFDDSVIRPQYGRARCCLDRTAVKSYIIFSTLILFLPNLIFIFLTMKIILDLKKGRRKLNRKNSKPITAQKNNNSEMILCLKLFVIMGVSWIFEIISGLTESGEVSWYWMITDMYNISQSFLLFWFFICKRTIREKLCEKYFIFKAGFKWMDVHVPRFSSGTEATTGFGFGSATEKSQSQIQTKNRVTKSSGFVSCNEKSSMQLSDSEQEV